FVELPNAVLESPPLLYALLVSAPRQKARRCTCEQSNRPKHSGHADSTECGRQLSFDGRSPQLGRQRRIRLQRIYSHEYSCALLEAEAKAARLARARGLRPRPIACILQANPELLRKRLCNSLRSLLAHALCQRRRTAQYLRENLIRRKLRAPFRLGKAKQARQRRESCCCSRLLTRHELAC